MSETIGMEDEFLEEMLGDFLDESDELLSQLNEKLLELDEWVSELAEGEGARCDDELMNEMFRGPTASRACRQCSAWMRSIL